jgi:hypothetical protein
MVKFTEIHIIGFSAQAMEAPQLVASDHIAVEVLRNIIAARQCELKEIEPE